MKEFRIEFEYLGRRTVVDLRRIVAMAYPKDGEFLIYFENAVWRVGERWFDGVYKAWCAI